MTRRTLKRAALGCFVAFAALAAIPILFPTDYEAHGRQAFADGAWSDAVDYLRLVHAKKPQDLDTTHLLATALRRKREFAEARALWEGLRSHVSVKDMATAAIAVSFADEGRFQDAFDMLAAEPKIDASAPLLEARGLVNQLKAEALTAEFHRYLSKRARRSTAAWAPATLLEARGLSDEGFAKKAGEVLSRLVEREGFADVDGFHAAYAPVRAAYQDMARDFAAASALAEDTLEADAEMLSFEIDRRDLDAARRHFDKIRALTPERLGDRTRRPGLEARRKRAVDLMWRAYDRAKRPLDAIAVLEEADDDRLREPLARLLFDVGRIKEAETIARLVIASEPRSAEANYVLGRLEKNPDRAADRLEVAHAVSPNDATFAWEYGRALRATGKASSALGVLMKALQRAPRNGLLNVEVSEVIAVVSGEEAGRAWLEQRYANEFKSTSSAESAIVLERILKRTAESEALATTYADALKEVADDPRNATKIVNLARLTISEKNDPAAALERVDELLLREERRADAWIVKADALGRLGREDEMLEAARKARRYAPTEPAPFIVEATSLLKRGHFRSAASIAAAGLEKSPNDAGLLFALAEASVGLGKAVEATAALDRVEGPEASSARALLLRGRTLVISGKATEAIPTLRRALDAAPDDPAARLALGEALLASDRVVEGAAALATLGGDPSVAADMRGAAAAALQRAGRYDDAAEIYAAVLRSTKAPAERADVAFRLMSCRASSSRPWTAVDVVYEVMKDGAVGAPSFGSLIALLEKSGSVAEAAELASFAKAQGIVGGAVHRAAFSAYLASGDPVAALDAADSLRFVPNVEPGEVATRRAEALFAIGRDAAAREAADEALTVAKGRLRVDASVVKLKLAVRADDAAKALAAISEIESSSPHASARDAVIEAFLALGRRADAERRLASGGGSSRTDGALIAASIRTAEGDLAGAAAALDAANSAYRVRVVRGLLVAAGVPGPIQARTYGEILSKIESGDAAGALASIESCDEDPRSLLGSLGNLARFASTKPLDARAVARDLAIARLHHDAGVLPAQRDAAFARAEERAPSIADDLRVLHAGWLASAGDGKTAAAIVLPLVERRAGDPATIFVAAAAAARNGGGAAAKKFIETLPTPAPSIVLRDVARFVARLGDGANALAILETARKPDTTLLRDRLRLLAELRRLKDATALAATLPPDPNPSPRDRVVRAWMELSDPKTKAAAVAAIESMLKDARLLDRFDGTLLLECAANATSDADFDRALESALRRAKFSAVEVDAVAAVLRTRTRDHAPLEAIERRLKLLDPTRRIRDASPRPIVYD